MCVCVRGMIFLYMPIWRWYNDNEFVFFIFYTHDHTCLLLITHYYSLLNDTKARCLWNDTLVWDLNSITRPRAILVQENVMTWPTRKGLRIKSQGCCFLFFGGSWTYRKFTADARAENGKSLGQAVSVAPRFDHNMSRSTKKTKTE